MKFSVFSIAALVTVVASADNPVDNLPPCVKECLGPFFQTGGKVAGCPQLDYKCVCENKDFLGKIACCAQDKCDPESKDAILSFAKPLCAAYKVEVPNDVDAACKASKGESSSSAGGSKPTGTQASSTQASESQAATGSNTAAAPAATKSNDASMNGASGALGAVAAMLMAL